MNQDLTLHQELAYQPRITTVPNLHRKDGKKMSHGEFSNILHLYH